MKSRPTPSSRVLRGCSTLRHSSHRRAKHAPSRCLRMVCAAKRTFPPVPPIPRSIWPTQHPSTSPRSAWCRHSTSSPNSPSVLPQLGISAVPPCSVAEEREDVAVCLASPARRGEPVALVPRRGRVRQPDQRAAVVPAHAPRNLAQRLVPGVDEPLPPTRPERPAQEPRGVEPCRIHQVLDLGTGIVSDAASPSEKPQAELALLSDARPAAAGSQTDVEATHRQQGFSSDGHGEAPGGLVMGSEGEVDGVVAEIVGRQVGREGVVDPCGSRPFEPKADTPTHAADARVGERIEERREPAGTGKGIVVDEGRHLAARGARRGVPCARRARARFDDAADRVPFEPAHRLDGAVARAVVDHQDLRAHVRGLRDEHFEERDQPGAAVAGRDGDGCTNSHDCTYPSARSSRSSFGVASVVTTTGGGGGCHAASSAARAAPSGAVPKRSSRSPGSWTRSYSSKRPVAGVWMSFHSGVRRETSFPDFPSTMPRLVSEKAGRGSRRAIKSTPGRPAGACTPSMAATVGKTSMPCTCSRTRPDATPGPAMTSGTYSSSSYRSGPWVSLPCSWNSSP